jgi:REP element-mobilizing transposase RayT
MAQSLAKIMIHIIFSTRHRHPFLHDIALRNSMHAYIAGVCERCESPAITIGGIADHVHILCIQGRTITTADLIKEIKASSSKWIKTQDSRLHQFGWQNGYGAFSVSMSQLAAVRRYITMQEEHHRQVTFQEEYRSFLRKYEIEFDERYVWE